MFEQVKRPVSPPKVKLVPKPEVKPQQDSQEYSKACEQLEALMFIKPKFCEERAEWRLKNDTYDMEEMKKLSILMNIVNRQEESKFRSLSEYLKANKYQKEVLGCLLIIESELQRAKKQR